ncbi:MAG: hypothetical protein ABIP94_11280 [Planctomycetota bacterium]
MRRGLVVLAVLLPGLAFGVLWLSPHGELPAPLAAARAGERERDDVETATAMAAYLGEPRLERTLVAEPRAQSDVLAEAADEPQVRRWIKDLRHDDIRWNASAGSTALERLGKGPIPALEAALRSLDLQQRQLAAQVLRRRCSRDGDTPSADLLRVSIEGLSSDICQQLRALEYGVVSASARFIVQHAELAQVPLRVGLGSGDGQQRFLCAFLLASAGLTDDYGVVARELVQHLADNQIGGDALMAVYGLYRLGAAALPIVRLWRPHVDAQARSLLDLVEMDLRQPPKDRSALYERGRLHRVTGIYHDPAIEFDVARSPVASFAER